jgi:hypothetical protein
MDIRVDGSMIYEQQLRNLFYIDFLPATRKKELIIKFIRLGFKLIMQPVLK